MGGLVAGSLGVAVLLTLVAGPAIAAESGLTVSERERLMYWDTAGSAEPAGDVVYFGEDARLRLESSMGARTERGGLRAPAGSWMWGSRFRTIADPRFPASDFSAWAGAGSRGSLLDQQKLGNVALTTRFSIRPRAVEELQTGVFFGYARVPLQGALAAESFKQAVGGAFINWENDRWRFVGQLSYVTGRVAGVAGRDSLVAGLGQAEYRFSPSWTLYGRGELAAIGTEDPSSALYPDFPRNRLAAGMRFDLARRQALSLEFASDSRFDQPRINQIDLRWRTEFK